MGISAGTRLGRYEILSQIGAGGMGEIYLARDTTELDRAVAIKVLSPELAADAERLRRFIQEAKTASSLNHHNIVTIYEIGETDSTRFIAIEYIEGETLRQRMARSFPSLRESLNISIQIASALAAAHRAGVVHRDVKPENVMIREDGMVKVLDFGLAKPMDQVERQPSADSEAATRAFRNTAPGMIVGTVQYMSPEQARGLPVDERTDIWSLAVILYEMMAGRVPFAGETTSDVIANILTKEPVALKLVPEEATKRLNEILRRALVKDREERYLHVSDLLIDVRRLRLQLSSESEIEGIQTPDVDDWLTVGTGHQSGTLSDEKGGARHTSSARAIFNRMKLHRRGVLLGLGAIIVALLALVAYFFHSPSHARGTTSVAVLPFTNMSGNSETEYLSDGISDGLINSLSQLPQLTVIARSSSFKFKGKEVDLQKAANALGVQVIVSGRVVQLGDQLQVSAEMVDVGSNRQLWGEQYTRQATDLLAVQEDIAREIADKLRLHLSGAQEQQLARRGTANPQAYELLLKGRFYNNKGATENWKTAVEYYRQAVDADPNYALAYAELADSYWRLIVTSNLDPKEWTPKAEALAQKSLELDEGLAEAHLAQANFKNNAWDWASAGREYHRAIELNPNLARARGQYASYLVLMERYDEAIAEANRARELDPLSLRINVNVGFALFFARRYDEATDSLAKSLELDHKYALAHVILGHTNTAKGMYPEAIREYREAIMLGDDSPSTQIYLGAAYARAGERENAQAVLRRLETSKEYVAPGELAILYTALGERDQAFAAFERAYTAHDLQLQFLGADPSFDSLSGDPRFQDLMKRVGLPRKSYD
ncbi:MAG: eukaryotic-like serine/threonine-protein kinase [Blastocatellia bacterium]|jgi:serine/threonine-protein kinase|nr:eukaryotic-like serine/threonine-protein kinase [Blastocatellia bacterium]